MSYSTSLSRPRPSRRVSTAPQSVRPRIRLSLAYSLRARNSHPGAGTPGQPYSAGDHGADEGPALFDRKQAGFELGVEEVPDMDHLGPDLQIDADIGGTGGLGQPDRVVEQGFRRTDLDQQWCQTLEIGINGCRQGRARIGAAEIEFGHLEDGLTLDYRIGGGPRRHRLADPFQVDPGRDAP